MEKHSLWYRIDGPYPYEINTSVLRDAHRYLKQSIHAGHPAALELKSILEEYEKLAERAEKLDAVIDSISGDVNNNVNDLTHLTPKALDKWNK